MGVVHPTEPEPGDEVVSGRGSPGTDLHMQVVTATEPPGVIVLDRRRSSRHTLHVAVSVTAGPETPCPPSETVDIGRHGILVRLAIPARPVCVGERVLVSLELEDGALHLLGRTTRSLRGDDDRWYLAVEFDEVEPMDRSRLDQLIDSAGPQPVPLRDHR